MVSKKISIMLIIESIVYFILNYPFKYNRLLICSCVTNSRLNTCVALNKVEINMT